MSNFDDDMDLFVDEHFSADDTTPEDSETNDSLFDGTEELDEQDILALQNGLEELADASEDDESDGDDEEAPPVKVFKVRVNRQDVEIPEHEAPAYIQKGMDYDRVKGQVESLRNDPRLAFVDNLAKQHGMSAEEYLTAYEKHQYKSELDNLLDQGIPENVAQEILATRKEKIAKAEAERAQKQQEKDKAGLMEFVEYFSKAHGRQFDVEADEIPATVWEAVAEGTPLKVAYMEYLVDCKEQEKAELAKKISAEESKKASRAKAPVKGTGHYGTGASPKKNPVFDGLFED